MVWTFWKREKSLFLARNQTADHSVYRENNYKSKKIHQTNLIDTSDCSQHRFKFIRQEKKTSIFELITMNCQ